MPSDFFYPDGPEFEPMHRPSQHPDYDRWVSTWGKMHADDENAAWQAAQARERHIAARPGSTNIDQQNSREKNDE